LSVPKEWKLIAYLCIGYPILDSSTPELLRRRWEATLPTTEIISKR